MIGFHTRLGENYDLHVPVPLWQVLAVKKD